MVNEQTMQINQATKPSILRNSVLLALVLTGLVLLGACGQKGDLYLPPEETQQQD
jgi:predicted small lipoprotein YifL